MKNIIKALAFTAIIGGALVGCDNKTSTPISSQASSVAQVSSSDNNTTSQAVSSSSSLVSSSTSKENSSSKNTTSSSSIAQSSSSSSSSVVISSSAAQVSSEDDTNKFPIAAILAEFPTGQGIIPIVTDKEVTYGVSSYPGNVVVEINFSSAAAAETAYNKYLADLVDYNYTTKTIWNGYGTAYFAPDKSFAVIVNPYFATASFHLDFYAGDSPHLK